MKNPDTAAFLSFIYPGLGQFYNGQIGKGIVFMVVQTVVILTYFKGMVMILYPIVLVWSIVDAYKTAYRIYQKQSKAE